MDYTKYVNTLPYPKRPDKPKHPVAPKKDATSSNYLEYAKQLEDYSKQLLEYEQVSLKKYGEDILKYDEENIRLQNQFKADALEEVGLTGHPKAEKAFSLAYEEGHSGGFSDIYCHLCNFAELLLD